MPLVVQLRPANTADIPAIARLLVQLYHAEQPGALRGPMDGQLALVRYTLERGGGALFRRYVLTDPDDAVIATGCLRYSYDRGGTTASGTMRYAARAIGPLNTLRLFGVLLRAGIGSELVLPPNTVYIHSVVVDAEHRHQGFGQALLGQLEQTAALDGARTAVLRVVIGNEPARRMYWRLGYRPASRVSLHFRWLMVPTELMRKPLLPLP